MMASRKKPSKRPKRRPPVPVPFWTRVLRTLPILILPVAFWFAEFIPWPKHFAEKVDHVKHQLHSRELSSTITLVTINETDLAALFRGSRPLDPRILGELIDAVLAAKPRAVGIDIATPQSTYASLARFGAHPEIIWAAPIVREGAGYRIDAAAGGTIPETRIGLAAMELDPDGQLRKYRRWLPASLFGKERESFVAAVSRAAGADPKRRDADEALLIEYGKDFRRISATNVLKAARGAEWVRNDWIRDRIVLIGVTYPEAADVYRTSLGQTQGVEIFAHAIETELHGRGSVPLTTPILFLIYLLGFPVVLVVTHRYGRAGGALLALVLIIAFTAITLSWTPAAGRIAEAVIVLLAIIVHHIIERLTSRAHAAANQVIESEAVSEGSR